ncbi:uncharacterized protein LOC117181292 [Belonocnema kinseyi]|uniref:uncharacterized protein LOC117181292 n=1 Tax=Belonocnema kinseyi TaxID=2817044 RepID=UPI00143DADEE|nr:uncharacterized protein LOC117181292 [Belonocnema kinseyi]
METKNKMEIKTLKAAKRKRQNFILESLMKNPDLPSDCLVLRETEKRENRPTEDVTVKPVISFNCVELVQGPNIKEIATISRNDIRTTQLIASVANERLANKGMEFEPITSQRSPLHVRDSFDIKKGATVASKEYSASGKISAVKMSKSSNRRNFKKINNKIRRISNPRCNSNELQLTEAVTVKREEADLWNDRTVRSLTNDMMSHFFSRETMQISSVTGAQCNVRKGQISKPHLDPEKVKAIKCISSLVPSKIRERVQALQGTLLLKTTNL